MSSVSYTHLDVYKRQGLGCTGRSSYNANVDDMQKALKLAKEDAADNDEMCIRDRDKASNKSDKATGSKNKQADSDMLNDYKLLQYYRLFDWEDK